MNYSEQRISCAQARDVDMVEYLAGLGHQPQKIKGTDYWYLSPLRKEKTASFKVNRKINRWFDHGIGKGGNIIDFAILYFNCTIGVFLQSLQSNFYFHQPANTSKHFNQPNESEKIIIREIKSLQHVVLIRYLHARHIPSEIAFQFCKEICFEFRGRSYFSIGFLNDAGGYELRNPYYKNSNAPKGITTIKNGSVKIAVFEGFFDFLSFQVLFSSEELSTWDYCILNSLSFFEKTISFLDRYSSVHLFLDRDTSGQNCSRKAIRMNTRYRDESLMYRGYKDLNEWLVSMGKEDKNGKLKEPP